MDTLRPGVLITALSRCAVKLVYLYFACVSSSAVWVLLSVSINVANPSEDWYWSICDLRCEVK